MKRFPLWTTLLPLVIGVGVYWFYWDRERRAFEASLEAVFSEGRASVGGFPYRLEAEVATPRFRHNGDYVFDASAGRAVINRQPWRRELSFIRLLKPRLQWRVPALGNIGFDVASAAAQTSLRLDNQRIVRLSSVDEAAQVRLPFVKMPAQAASFEWHFRETPAAPDPASRAPTFPEQAQLVLAANGLRFGRGDPLTLAAQIGITSPAPVWDLASWRRGGTVELRRLTLADKTGEVMALTATGSASLADPLRIAGTVETVCPESVQALFAGRPLPAREYRARRPVTFSFGGTADDLRLLLPAGGAPRRTVREQEPACPMFGG